jgi:hypothetical protein
VSGASVAKARDDHYHQPPDYLVVEPNDTSARTRNLQQTNTNGYKWQGTEKEREAAQQLLRSWVDKSPPGSTPADHQEIVQELRANFHYRLDTNFAKIDRIRHSEIEAFKGRVLSRTVHGMTIQKWAKILCSDNESRIERALRDHVKIDWDKELVQEPSTE